MDARFDAVNTRIDSTNTRIDHLGRDITALTKGALGPDAE